MKRTLMVAGVLAVVVLALLIVACGSEPTPTSVQATSSPTTPTEASAVAPPTVAPTVERAAPPTPRPATPAPTVAPTPAPTAAPTAAATTPAPTPEEPEEPDASDTYFAMDRVLEVSIEIAEEDWNTLRHQTRTFDDLMTEIEELGLSRPFADIYTWFSGTVTIDGETHTDVGVRKKGFLGSQSDTKPSLKLRYDKYVDGQSLGGVMERMTLNNSIQDASMVNTCLVLPGICGGGAAITALQLRDGYGQWQRPGPVYSLGGDSRNRSWPGISIAPMGNLYEGTVSDFTPEYRGTIRERRPMRTRTTGRTSTP